MVCCPVSGLLLPIWNDNQITNDRKWNILLYYFSYASQINGRCTRFWYEHCCNVCLWFKQHILSDLWTMIIGDILQKKFIAQSFIRLFLNQVLSLGVLCNHPCQLIVCSLISQRQCIIFWTLCLPDGVHRNRPCMYNRATVHGPPMGKAWWRC